MLLVNIFNWLLGLAGVVAFLFLVWGAFQMVYGWLAEDPEHTFKAGMLTVRRAIWGLVLVAGAYLAVNVLLTQVLQVEGGKGLDEYFGQLCKASGEDDSSPSDPPPRTPPTYRSIKQISLTNVSGCGSLR